MPALAGHLLPYYLRLALRGVRIDNHAAHRLMQWRSFGVLLLLAGIAGCCPKPITRPVVVEIERRIIEPIPVELLRAHPISAGRVSECPAVAAQRRAELQACNADKAAISAMQERAE